MLNFLNTRCYFWKTEVFRVGTNWKCSRGACFFITAIIRRWRELGGGSRTPRSGCANSCGRSIDAKSSEETGAASGPRARTFAVGDVVWGPVKGYSSWPGKLRARLQGARWAVRWFGALGAAALPQARLLTLSEGLDQHHAARTKHRK